MLLNVILNNNDLYRNNPISEHLPVSDGEEYGFYNKMYHVKKKVLVSCFFLSYITHIST